MAKSANTHHDITRAHMLVQILETDLCVSRSERVCFQSVARTKMIEIDLFLRQQTTLITVGDRFRMVRIQVAEVTDTSVALALTPNHRANSIHIHSFVHELETQIRTQVRVRVVLSGRYDIYASTTKTGRTAGNAISAQRGVGTLLRRKTSFCLRCKDHSFGRK